MEEAEKALEILRSAMKMEKDGREFYLKSAENSQSDIARNLFEVLAKEEIVHQEVIGEIYEALKSGNQWPDVKITPVHDKNAENIFSAALKDPQQQTAATDDLEAVGIALKMEERAYRLYSDRAKESTYPAEENFYKALAIEEQSHIMSLRDTEEYLTDTEGWFMKKQHITLDGDS
ncbi:MAG: ferritin family protein [Chloroflexi bacterium]|jgi:rubrerythrin|nr:ferritin family protein [Chloroflexota bacterium]